MQVKSLKKNLTQVRLPLGQYVLYSYETPVAIDLGNGVILKTEEFFSQTTSRHLNQWIADRKEPGITSICSVSQNELEWKIGYQETLTR